MLKNFDEFMEYSREMRDVVGAWGFNSNLNFAAMAPEESNVWFFEQVFNFLRAFFGLVVPDKLELITYNATQHIKRSGLDQQTFLDELMLIMKGLKEPLWTFKLGLNIIGFLKTTHQKDMPTRLQIQEPCHFIAWGGPDETGFQNFSISYHLFSTLRLEDQDQELWSLNQPLLEKGLKKWETQSGHRIEVVDSTGNVPVHTYGFGRK
ncbi:MAG: hypothetical protein KDK66_00260 [Deltaproteobacteria bacterium]|nr:hypothetical protein [Deltaproteobacteria bacterium]